MEFLGCRSCGLVQQVSAREGSVAPAKCMNCGRRLEAMSADESRQLTQRRLARQRVQRLSRATVAQQLRRARSQTPRGKPAL